MKLNPPRPSFALDMTDAERAIMMQHVTYWAKLLENKIAIAYGPVFDPKGGYGVGIAAVETEDQLKQIIADDPANGLNQYEYYPMTAIY